MSILEKIKHIFSSKSYVSELVDIGDDSAAVLLGLSEGQPITVTPRAAYYLSERNSDLGSAISRISESISSLKKILKDTKGNVIDEHPFLSLINSPGEGMGGSQYWRELTESYLLTQEGWTVLRGNINRPPLSMVFIRPYDVQVQQDMFSGIPAKITTTSTRDRREYFRVIEGNGYRFIDKDKINELVPIIGAVSINDEWRGRSPLSKLFYDLKMNTDGKRHNVSLLKNGMRTTGILTPSKTTDTGGTLKWSKDAVESIEKKMRAFHQGAGNAGNFLILSTPAEVAGLEQSNKDMDYVSLLKNSQVAIYNLYNIPLPLVMSETMTYSNYTTASRIYYTDCVFPVFNNIASTLMQYIAPRYKLQNMQLTFMESAIPGLQPVLVENMKALKETEAVSINDIRAVGGYVDVIGGNDILITANKIPLTGVSIMPGFTEVGDEGEPASNNGDSDQAESIPPNDA